MTELMDIGESVTEELTPEHLRAICHAFMTGSPTRQGLEHLLQFADAWETERTAFEQRVESLVEDLEDAHIDRAQLLAAIQYAAEFLPEYPGNVRVRAKLEMALTDLIVPQEEE